MASAIGILLLFRTLNAVYCDFIYFFFSLVLTLSLAFGLLIRPVNKELNCMPKQVYLCIV
jgi:hypothetical protein